MNKNQTHGIAENIVGKVQEQAGKLVGSTEQQVKGIKKQVSGKVEEKVGDAKAALKDARNTADSVARSK